MAVIEGRAGDFWKTYGRRQRIVRKPIEGKDARRLCATYRRLIGYPVLRRHDPRYGGSDGSQRASNTTSSRSGVSWGEHKSIETTP